MLNLLYYTKFFYLNQKEKFNNLFDTITNEINEMTSFTSAKKKERMPNKIFHVFKKYFECRNIYTYNLNRNNIKLPVYLKICIPIGVFISVEYNRYAMDGL